MSCLLFVGLCILLVATSAWPADYDDLGNTRAGLKSSDRWSSMGRDFSTPSFPAASNMATLLFRDPPTLTTQYGAGKSWVPFFGLGFQGGETSDVTRQLLRESLRQSLMDNPMSFSSLNKSLMPNEFQGGLRIPF